MSLSGLSHTEQKHQEVSSATSHVAKNQCLEEGDDRYPAVNIAQVPVPLGDLKLPPRTRNTLEPLENAKSYHIIQ